MPLLTSFLLLLLSARLLGNLAQRLGHPDIVGEMLAGILLGPAVLNLVHPNAALSGISELAVFLIILSAGLEMSYKDIMSAIKGDGLVIAIFSFFIPFAAGSMVGYFFDLDAMRIVFLGLCVSITALPVTVRILESLGMLDSKIAKYSVAAAVINDILALLVLGVILNLPKTRDYGAITLSILLTIGKLAILMALITLANMLMGAIEKKGLPLHKGPEKLIAIFGNEALLGLVVIFVLVFGSVSELLGFHFVVGAFFGALLISKDYFVASRYHELEKTISSVTKGFLAPLFFAYLGLEFAVGEIKSIWFVIAVLSVSVFSKILSGWLGGIVCKMPSREALGLGIILNGRGVMELVVASIALQHGFIGKGLFSTLVLMGIFTTMITPLLFNKVQLSK